MNTKQPESWIVDADLTYRILQSDGRPVAVACGGGHKNPFTADENAIRAKRIVACINACTGFSNDELEEVAKHGGFIDQTRYNAKITKQLEGFTRARQVVEDFKKMKGGAA